MMAHFCSCDVGRCPFSVTRASCACSVVGSSISRLSHVPCQHRPEALRVELCVAQRFGEACVDIGIRLSQIPQRSTCAYILEDEGRIVGDLDFQECLQHAPTRKAVSVLELSEPSTMCPQERGRLWRIAVVHAKEVAH